VSSRRNKRRRSQKEWREAPILRLVRPEEPSISVEPEPTGLAPPSVNIVSESIGPDAGGGAEENQRILVAAVEPEPTGGIAAINPIPVEPGIYLVEFDGVSKGPHLTAYRLMFTQTDCLGLLSKIPLDDGITIAVAVLLGWKKLFDSRGIGHWELCYNDWIRQTPDLMDSGVNFIERIDSVIQAEPSQLLHLGALVEMLCAGQYDKAVALYNGWARFADYGQIELKSHQPALIDVGNALLQFRDGDFKVVRVR